MKKQTTKSIQLKGETFKIPVGGTLGLLALGNIGVRAWKEAKANNLKDKPEEKNEKK